MRHRRGAGSWVFLGTALVLVAGVSGVLLTSPAQATITPPVVALHLGAHGEEPLDVAVDYSNGVVYTANSYSDTVSVLDGRANFIEQPGLDALKATLKVGSHPWAVAVDPNTDMVYVANDGSSSVSVINGHTNKVVTTVPNIAHPLGIGVVDATGRVYVTEQGGPDQIGKVAVLNGKTGAVVANIPVGYTPWGVGVDQTSQRVYVADSYGYDLTTTGYFVGAVTVIQGTSPLATIGLGLGNSPSFIAADPVHHRVYVSTTSEDSSGSVVVINSLTNRALEQISVPNPMGVDVDPGANVAYVAQGYQDDFGGPLYVIDTKLEEVAAVVNVSPDKNVKAVGSPWGIAVDPDTERVFMSEDSTAGIINVVDLHNYYIPNPTPVPATTVPDTPVTTAPPPPVTIPPQPAGSWCALVAQAGANELLTGVNDDGPIAINSNAPASLTSGTCGIYAGDTLLGVQPQSSEPTLSPNGTYAPVPALGAGAEVYTIKYGPIVAVWWPEGGQWVLIELTGPDSVTAAQEDVFKPDVIKVAEALEGLLSQLPSTTTTTTTTP